MRFVRRRDDGGDRSNAEQDAELEVEAVDDSDKRSSERSHHREISDGKEDGRRLEISDGKKDGRRGASSDGGTSSECSKSDCSTCDEGGEVEDDAELEVEAVDDKRSSERSRLLPGHWMFSPNKVIPSTRPLKPAGKKPKGLV
jgi:hypothetical protein